MCIKKGEQLTSDEGHLFRQVLPRWFSDDGVPTTQAFWPWRKVDECCLSVDRSTITTAHKAFTLFTEPAPNGFNVPSGGVWSMMMSDVPEAQISLWEDALQAAEGVPANPAHALLDFEKIPEKQREKLGRVFKVKSLARGRLFPPASPTPAASPASPTPTHPSEAA